MRIPIVTSSQSNPRQVAALLSQRVEITENSENSEKKRKVRELDIKISSPPGRAFCFLPLPCFTGLSVHVNGYFELSANR
eukprot:567080-Amorphochlora_amoeboformis.AAC.1